MITQIIQAIKQFFMAVDQGVWYDKPSCCVCSTPLTDPNTVYCLYCTPPSKEPDYGY